MSPGDFFHLLDDSIDPKMSSAVKLLQIYAKEGDRQLLRDFYYQDDRRTETACLEMAEAGETPLVEERIMKLKAASKAFGEDKERAFEAKVGPRRPASPPPLSLCFLPLSQFRFSPFASIPG